MSRLAEILNPATPSTAGPPARHSQDTQFPEQDQPKQIPTGPPPVIESAFPPTVVPGTAYEAARVLTSLANPSASPPTIAANQAPGPSDYLPPNSFFHIASFTASPRPFDTTQEGPSRPPNTLGPVEIAGPFGYQPEHTRSPTLEQYHHSSYTVSDWRRHSASGSTASQVLAPLQPRRVSTNYPTPTLETVGQVERSLQTAEIKMDGHSHDRMDIDGPTEDQAGQALDSPVNVSSPPVKIKTEPTGTPREGTPQSIDRKASLPRLDIDDATLRAVTDLKKDELGLRSASRESATPSSAMEPPKQLPTATNKKRAPPKSTKKGTATKKKGAPRKRKADVADTRDSTPTTKPRGHTAKSKSGTPRPSNSPAPSRTPSDALQSEDEGDESGSDEGVFCICRKGDNHTWMIGCDGGCEDWFHGKCVGVSQSNGALIDKYICPNCHEAGRGTTTYLPQCRRPGCQKPARAVPSDGTGKKKGGKRQEPSKYCSDECGQAFMLSMVERSQNAALISRGETPNAKTTKRKKNDLDHELSSSADHPSDDDLGPRGGPLKPTELASITSSTANIETFRNLGHTLAPPTPPPTSHSNPPLPVSSSPPKTDVSLEHQLAEPHLTQSDRDRLADLSIEKSNLRNRREALGDWERFLGYMFENTRKQNQAPDGKKLPSSQTVCGYDPRVAWNEAEFAAFAGSPAGQRILSLQAAKVEGNPPDNVDQMDVDGVDGVNGTNERPTCVKKRCTRHAQWQRNASEDLKAERANIMRQTGVLDKEEKDIWERAGLRARKVAGGGEGLGKRIEGWAETIG